MGVEPNMNTQEASEKVADFSMRLDRVERHNQYTIHSIERKMAASIVCMGTLIVIAFLVGLAL